MYVWIALVDLPALVLLGFAAFTNAIRNTISIFVLLIVSLGYGVVKASSLPHHLLISTAFSWRYLD
jgi:hypothetical protein